MKRALYIILLFQFSFFNLQFVRAQAISPFDYGLREASGGMGRYFALYNAHVEALRRGVEVDYSGIDTLELELPPSWKSIPLGVRTDFGGAVFYVTNHAHHGALFALSQPALPLEMDKALVDGLDFRQVPELAAGWHLLVLNDEKPWTERRGFGYMQYRKDLIVVHDGRGLNSPVMPWGSDSTRLKASCVEIDTAQKVFRNITMHRTKGCSFRTTLISVSGQYNVLIEHARVTTPKSKMIADGIFSISNSARVTLDGIEVEGTYSGKGRPDVYGYAFSLNNLYDAHFHNIVAWGNWGVFGSNNLNRTHLSNCHVDRFDIHCYGRDVLLENCTLEGRQTLLTSFYGKAEFDHCHFKNYIPMRIRSSYNAYTPFDIEIRSCTWEISPRYHYLVRVNLLDTADNPRPELREKCWPNLYVDSLNIVVPLTVGRVYVFDPCDNRADLKREIGYVSEVQLNGITMMRPNGRQVKIPLDFTTYPFKSKHPITYEINGHATVLQ